MDVIEAMQKLTDVAHLMDMGNLCVIYDNHDMPVGIVLTRTLDDATEAAEYIVEVNPGSTIDSYELTNDEEH